MQEPLLVGWAIAQAIDLPASEKSELLGMKAGELMQALDLFFERQ